MLVERDFDAYVSISVIRKQMVDDGEIVGWAVAAIGADPLVDCRQVVEHAVAECPLDLRQDVAYAVARHPRRGNLVARRLPDEVDAGNERFDLAHHVGAALRRP